MFVIVRIPPNQSRWEETEKMFERNVWRKLQHDIDCTGGGVGTSLFVEKIINLVKYISKNEKDFHGILVVG